ncbi:MAG: MFS transporter [Novosphingobium sp.]
MTFKADSTSPIQERTRHRAFLTVLAAFVLDIMDSTIVTVAIPAIQQDMHLSDSAVQWSVAGYFLSFAVLLVTGGRLGDLYGHRRLFLTGIAAFTVASLACGFAGSGEALVLARVVQGATAALMAPQVMAIVQILYSPTERIGRLAFFGLIGGLAAIAGPLVGGFVIEADLLGLGWRMIFLINLPVGLGGVIAGWRYLPRERPGARQGLDAVGIVLLGISLLLLLLPLIDGRERGWPLWSFLVMAASVPTAGLFFVQQARRQRRVGDALFPPTLLQDRCYALGVGCVLLFATATGGLFLPLMLTLQKGLGFSAFEAALLHIPFAAGAMIGIVLLGRRLLPRFGKYVVIAGALVMALAVVNVGSTLAHGGVVTIGASLLLAGIGMGMVSGPLTPLALARVDRAHAGMASGAFKSVQQIGGALGAALLGTLYFMNHGALGSATGAMGVVSLGIAFDLLCVAALAGLMPRAPFAA